MERSLLRVEAGTAVSSLLVERAEVGMVDVASASAHGSASSAVELEHVQLSRGIRVRQLQTTFDEATCLDAREAQGRAKRILHDGHFDYAPVLSGGDLLGYVAEADLKTESEEPVDSQVRPITSKSIVSGEASFHDLLRWLDSGFLFVLEGNRLTGFVTPSDTNRQAARSYFYLLVAEVEVGLARLIHAHFQSVDEALNLLSENRRERIQERRKSDRQENLDADVVSYFDFCDLTKVAGRTEAIRLGFSRNKWDDVTGSLTDLRNWVMHPTRSGLSRTYTIARLIDFEERLIDLSNRIYEQAAAR